jgi:hypothetical protein
LRRPDVTRTLLWEEYRDRTEVNAVHPDVRARRRARQPAVGMPAEVDVAAVLAGPHPVRPVRAPDTLDGAVRERDEHAGDVEDAIPGQARANAVVVAPDEEALATVQARENGSRTVLGATVAPRCQTVSCGRTAAFQRAISASSCSSMVAKDRFRPRRVPSVA